jgi:hypothetical protein
MARKREWPKEVKAGSVTVKVYRVRHRTAAGGFAYTVSYTRLSGERALKQFTDEGKALEEARLKAAQLANGQLEASSLSVDDRRLLLAAKDLCGESPLLSVLREWRKASELTQGFNSSHAVWN